MRILRLSMTVVLSFMSFCICVMGAAHADPSGVRVGELTVQSVAELSVDELWHMSIPEHLFAKRGNAPGGAVGLWKYDHESGLSDGDWIAIGVVMVGFGDIAETPVALRIWAKRPSRAGDISLTESAAPKGYAMSFDVKAADQRFQLIQTVAGVVQINGVEVGHVR